jgi:hypothetical protein
MEEGAREIPAPELLDAFEQERASSSMKPMPPQGRRTFFALGIRRRHDRRLWRALWYGRRIAVHVVGEVSAPGVDAYEDLVLIRIRYQKKMDFSILQRCRVVSLSC